VNRFEKHVPLTRHILCRMLPLLITMMIWFTSAGIAADNSCNLKSANGDIKHVIYLQFDNVHLRRDNPNVPSDLEQMPHLLNFLTSNGTMLNKHYTILISHTAGGILASLTGLNPDRMGMTVSNSYDFYNPVNGTATFSSGFKYWTAPVSAPVDNVPNMVNGDSGTPKTAPAPWVSYTRAGCDVGNISVANTVLENNNAVIFTTLSAAAAAGANNIKVGSITGLVVGNPITVDVGATAETHTIINVGTSGAGGTGVTLNSPLLSAHSSGARVYVADPTGDMTTVFGVGSPEWIEGRDSQFAAAGSAARNLAQTDFVGIAIHCANNAASVCNNNNHAKTDPLPDEPGGYFGFSALFGAKHVNPAITGGLTVVNDLNGVPIADSFGQPGFPGFDSMPVATTLAYVAQMQEAGIPITYAYISDVHDSHAGFGAYGPGEAPYVAALKSYDDAFAAFFIRLAAHGINTSNTLFIVTADENDHYAGQQAQNCDGVNTPCVYNSTPGLATGGKPAHGIFDLTNGGKSFGPIKWPPDGLNGPLVGEVGYDMKFLLGSTINGVGYDISFDSAPSFYINGQAQAVDASGNIVLNPTLRAFEKSAANLKAYDPYLPPTDWTGRIQVAKYLVDAPTLKAIHMINADPQRTMSFTMFAQPDFFFQTFSPCPAPSEGCLNDGFAWIHGDYSNDIGQTWLGVAGPGVNRGGLDDATWTDHTDIVPTINALVGLKPDYQPDGRVITQILTAAPTVVNASSDLLTQLGDVYKQVNAPYGDYAHSVIVASTNGIKADDSTYLSTEQQIQSLTSQRNFLAQQMKDVLDGTVTGHPDQLILDGLHLLQMARTLAGL